MVARLEITDEQWAQVEPFVRVERAETGRPPRDEREMLNGLLWVLRTGAPWRDLPERFGPWQTVYHYFNAWRSKGTFDRILEALQIRLDREGKIDWDLWCIDGSNVRAARAAAGATKKVSSDISTSPQTTRWGARAADSAANSTWSLTLRAFPSPSK
jgi:transposase